MSQPSSPKYPELSRIRVEYMQRSLSEAEVSPDPVAQFASWLNEAIVAVVREPTAMTLATCTRDGAPSARIVLLKGVDANGFVFFTNYQSRKGRELAGNPRAALVFFWSELERQVRVEGEIALTSAAESDAYFASRPAASRLGSAASPQSEPVASRAALEQRERDLLERYPDGNVPRPAHWGGYRLRPAAIEFWQGGPGRLHDRIEYRRQSGGEWSIRRLAP